MIENVNLFDYILKRNQIFVSSEKISKHRGRTFLPNADEG